MFFFFNDTATTEIYTLSLHDALPIWSSSEKEQEASGQEKGPPLFSLLSPESTRIHFNNTLTETPYANIFSYQYFYNGGDRKSTRLNSSHANISYAVFCLKKKTSLIVS